MHRTKIGILCALCVTLQGIGAHSAELLGKVTWVCDGDTVWVTDASKQMHKVRLDRIDAPEKDQPWGKESAAVLKDWVLGKDVRVEYGKRDCYGRIPGIVFRKNDDLRDRSEGWVDINLKMIRTGNAWHYRHFDMTPEYVAAEAEARAARRGLWSQDNPVNPYKWRQTHRK